MKIAGTVTVRFRQDTVENWMKYDPIIRLDELVISTDDYRRFKVGNGESKWSELAYRKQLPERIRFYNR